MSEMEHPWSIEERCFAAGYETVCGADEAGAGPLAGPVYAAAVILPRGLVIDGLNDSKKLSPKKREALFDTICAEAEDFCVAWVEAEEIDCTDILSARIKAMSEYIVKRLILACFTLLTILLVSYVLLRLAPGDPTKSSMASMKKGLLAASIIWV